MEIAVVCNVISGRGGTEVILTKVLNHLAKNNSNHIQLVLSNKTKYESWLTKLDKNIEIIYPKHSGRLWRLAYFFKYCLKIKGELLVINLSPNLIRYFYLLRKILNKRFKLVSWFHFSLANKEQHNPNNLKYADYHLVLNSLNKEELIRIGVKEENIFLIFNPVTPQNLISENSSDNPKRIIYIGRIELKKEKNLSDLLLAIPEVNKDVKFDIYGGGDELDQAKSFAGSLHINDRIKWHGWVTNVWEHIDFLPSALVLTSKYEGLGMVLLEAMSRGIPCISSDFLGVKDIIINGKNGYTYEVGNPKSLAKKINVISSGRMDSEKIRNSIEKYYEDNYYRKLYTALKKIWNY